MTIIRQAKQLFLFSSLFLVGCSALWEKDNTPPPSALTHFKHTVSPRQSWDNRVSYDLKHDHLKLTPALSENLVVTTDPVGAITVVDRSTGKTRWKPYLNTPITTGAAVGEGLVVVGGKNGTIIALSLAERKELWRNSVRSEVLASPVIVGHRVIIKAIDGKITAFDAQDGHFIWSYLGVEPNLILRGASTPQVAPGALIIGFASGKVVKLSLQNGHELWSQSITQPDGAFAIQRMVDIDANPVVYGNRVYAVSYQGKVAALDLNSGSILWDHNISAHAGLAVDESKVYVSDSQGHVYAFDRNNGRIVWVQNQLEARGVTGPALTTSEVAVGDNFGVLHWINKNDGAFAARNYFGGSGILANPVSMGNTVYVLTQDGYLNAYTVR